MLVNLTLADANAFVVAHHRHSKKATGHKFSIGATSDGALVGVAIVGRPVARRLDDGVTCEVLRLCTLPDAPRNVCSFLYRAAWRAWAAMGGQRLVTYLLASEAGHSVRGAGMRQVAVSPAWTPGKGWTTRSNRQWQQVHAEGKVRWEIVAHHNIGGDK